jgi:hypothetical protein
LAENRFNGFSWFRYETVKTVSQHCDCLPPGLTPGVIEKDFLCKAASTGFAQKVGKMPRACPVEYHARDYTDDLKQQPGGHGLGPWRFTFLAK